MALKKYRGLPLVIRELNKVRSPCARANLLLRKFRSAQLYTKVMLFNAGGQLWRSAMVRLSPGIV